MFCKLTLTTLIYNKNKLPCQIYTSLEFEFLQAIQPWPNTSNQNTIYFSKSLQPYKIWRLLDMDKQLYYSEDQFVGRKDELALLHNNLNQMLKYKNLKMVFIRGDYGVGKTTLVNQFITEAKQKDSSLNYAQGHCSMETENNGLVPFIQILFTLGKEGAKKRIIRGDVWGFLKKVAPAWLDIITLGLASPIATTYEEGKKLLSAQPKTKFSSDNVFIQFSNSLHTLAEKKPVAIFIDDIQWADSSSLRLLFHLANNLKEHCVLIIVSYRPVEAEFTSLNSDIFREVHANLLRLGATEINLEQGIDVSDYTNRRYENHKFPKNIIMKIQDVTDGHPLFVEQLFSYWEESGVIESSPNNERTEWIFSSSPDFSTIPQTVSVVLEARLKLLSERLKSILNCASVEGDIFTIQIITKLIEIDELQIYNDIDVLEKNYQLVIEEGTKNVGKAVLDFYRFIHRFFREYIYEQLSSAQKRVLHRRVGECLEKLYIDKRSVASQLARHFHVGREMTKAIKYIIVAAKWEQSRYMWNEAQELCTSGILWLTKLKENAGKGILILKFDLLETLADSYLYPANYIQAEKVFKEAATLGEKLNIKPERIAKLYERLAVICDEGGRVVDGMKFVQQGKNLLKAQHIQSGESFLSLLTIESLLLGRQDYDEAAYRIIEEVLSAANELPQSVSVESVKGEAYQVKGIILSYLCRFSDAASSYKIAVEIGEKISNYDLQIFSLCCLSEDYIPLGQLEESRVTAQKALEISQKIGEISGEAYATYCLGLIHLEYEENVQALDELKKALALCKRSGAVQYYFHSDLAIAYNNIDNDKAIEEAKRGLKLAKVENWGVAYATTVLGKVEFSRQNWTKAINYFDKALSIYNNSNDHYLAGIARREYVKILLIMGEQKKAYDVANQAKKIFIKMDLPYEVAKLEKIIAPTS